MKNIRPLGLLFLLALALPAMAAERPNLLFVFADDWGRLASIYAEGQGGGSLDEVVSTPNFDRLAREGVLFRNAHVSAPSCTPCRSSLLTGQHFWRTGTGAILRGAVWDASLPSFPLLLQEAGYTIGYSHKVWGPGTPSNAPFTKAQAFAKRGSKFNQFSQHATAAVAAGKTPAEAKAALVEESRGNFEDFLASAPQDQPWLYWFGPTNTHRKWIRGSGKALWDIDPDSLKGRMPSFLPDVPEVREDLADYLGEVEALDAGLGVLLGELERRGLRDDTLVVVSGDHGPPGFLHGKCNLYRFGTNVPLTLAGPGVKGGRVVDDFVSLTDLAPTFLEAAGVGIPEVMTGRSLWPVLSSEKEGQVDPARKRVFTGRERHVENARADFSPYPQRALRTARHVLIVNFRPDRYPMGDPYGLDGSADPPAEVLANETRVTLPDEDAGPTKAWVVGARNTEAWGPHYDAAYGKRPRLELYDLEKDPDETTNVADDPAYAEIRERMEGELMDELARTGDPRLVEEGSFFETPPMAGPLPEAAKGKGRGKGRKR